jgi:hypothetical protein
MVSASPKQSSVSPGNSRVGRSIKSAAASLEPQGQKSSVAQYSARRAVMRVPLVDLDTSPRKSDASSNQSLGPFDHPDGLIAHSDSDHGTPRNSVASAVDREVSRLMSLAGPPVQHSDWLRDSSAPTKSDFWGVEEADDVISDASPLASMRAALKKPPKFSANPPGIASPPTAGNASRVMIGTSRAGSLPDFLGEDEDEDDRISKQQVLTGIHRDEEDEKASIPSKSELDLTAPGHNKTSFLGDLSPRGREPHPSLGNMDLGGLSTPEKVPLRMPALHPRRQSSEDEPRGKSEISDRSIEEALFRDAMKEPARKGQADTSGGPTGSRKELSFQRAARQDVVDETIDGLQQQLGKMGFLEGQKRPSSRPGRPHTGERPLSASALTQLTGVPSPDIRDGSGFRETSTAGSSVPPPPHQ